VVLKVGVVAKRRFRSPEPGIGISFFCLHERGSVSVSRNIFRHSQFTN